MKYLLTFILVGLSGQFVKAQSEFSLKGECIFPPDKQRHGHTHASSIVECPNGDLLVCWYEGETDRSRDVHIQAARLPTGQNTWSETFLLADTPMLSDNNPCLFVDDQNRLWLFYYTLLGSPEEAWDTAYLRYKISSNYQDSSQPIVWDVQQDLPVIPNQLDETIDTLCQKARKLQNPEIEHACEEAEAKLKDQLTRRLGWTTRAKPIVLSTGALLLPMAHEFFGLAAMALTSDGGKTWRFSTSPLGYGVEQPTVFERQDGSLAAYFRDSSPAHRIRKSESDDHGMSWTPISETEFPNPGSGIEVLRMQNGHLILIYNDCESAPRNSLAVSISDDDGTTWKWTRHIEQSAGHGRFDYPSIIQTYDGLIHATYSYNVQTIKHVVFSEEWVMQGD